MLGATQAALLGMQRGSAAFDPSQLAGLFQWYDAADITTLFQDLAGATPVTTNNQLVGQWRDKGPNGFHVAAPTTNDRPSYLTNMRNGLPVVQFAAKALRRTGVSGIGQQQSMFMAGQNRRTGTSNFSYFWQRYQSSTYSSMLYYFAGMAEHWNSWSNAVQQAMFPVMNQTPAIFGTRWYTANVNYAYSTALSGVPSANTNSPGVGAASHTFTLGGTYNSLISFLDLYELIIVDGDVGDATAKQVMQYLADKWGFTLGA